VIALFAGLFDDAALFPPGNSPMAVAVTTHRAWRARQTALVGPFVIPASRLDELVTHLGVEQPPFDVSLIAPAGDLPTAVARVTSDPRLALSAIEIPVAADAAAARKSVRVLDAVLPEQVPASIEVPRTGARDPVLDVLLSTGYRAKLRTGGLGAELFPSPTEFAATLQACITRGIAVKCTAGLHSAIRRTDSTTGITHHGFLNVLLAVAALSSGAPASVAADWLAEADAGTVVWGVRALPAEAVARARKCFTSFGTCSVLEPVDDLVGLGLLPALERSIG
jgi:hypothetical protein